MECLEEIWITLRNEPDYEISNMGRVRRKKDNRILSIGVRDKRGYRTVAIHGKNKYLYRLVAATFFNLNEDEKYDIIHLDGDKSNNKLSNLLVVNRKETLKRGRKNGRKKHE